MILKFWGWQNIGGGQLPPLPPPPCSYDHERAPLRVLSERPLYKLRGSLLSEWVFKGGRDSVIQITRGTELAIQLYTYWLTASRIKRIPMKSKELAERPHAGKIGTSYALDTSRGQRDLNIRRWRKNGVT